MPSNEAPRRAPSPPRPKSSSVTQMGLGVPAAPKQSATATPLGLGVAVKPMPSSDALSIWDTEQTIAINAPEPLPAPVAQPVAVKARPRPPVAPKPALKAAPLEAEPELIDAEEIPASSSGAPTLEALKLEAGRPKPARGKRAPDEFLVNLSAGTQGILGAPTIDVSGLDSPVPPVVQAPEEEEVEFHQATRSGRAGTMPLFDMSAVLPAASGAVKLGGSNAAPEHEAVKGLASAPPSAGRARERKFVIAPQQQPAAVAEPKTRRSAAALWFGLVAVAAGIVAIVGLRGHRTAPPENEPHVAVEAPAPVAPTATVAAALPAPEESAASAAPSAAPSGAPSTATALKPAATAAVAAAVPNGDKSAALEKPEPAEKPTAAVESAAPAVEKPSVVEKPVEAHNAPPPAEPGTEFDRAAARSALASAAAQASACRKDGDPSGTATLTITFAPSGRVTSANIQGPPFAGTPTGGCIANTMRHASVPAFSGEHVTVTKTIVVQ